MSSRDGLVGARRLRELFAAHGVHPRKHLGQNFVIDPNTIRKVLEAASISPADRIVEIGAGGGSLTVGLAGRSAHVIAVELDERLLPVLASVLNGLDNVEVLHADATMIDLGSLDAHRLVGNLPYSAAATIVVKVLQQAPQIGDLTVMVQKEVGERLTAVPGSKIYGQTSVLVGHFSEARVVARLSQRAFFPMPKVDSVLLRIVRRSDVPNVDARVFFELVKRAFRQRRKMIRKALADLTGSAGAAERALAAAGIDPASRAEDLAPDDFAALARVLS
jgi:16S rRNA (adenine1518-N6/adenine1519-N6)-dimethyltransferase